MRQQAAMVPPVASRSSTISTRWPRRMASACISSVSVPYSRAYSALMAFHGSLPGLRMGTKPAPSSIAAAVPKMNPRLSAPHTTSTRASRKGSTSRCTACDSPCRSASSGVMSLKMIPFLGKSGTSRISRSSETASSTLSPIASSPSPALTIVEVCGAAFIVSTHLAAR